MNQPSARPRLSVVLPIHNEEDIVPLLHKRLTAVLDQLEGQAEIIFVNDGSGDRSLEKLREARRTDPRVRVVSFTRNFGHQKAITAGLDVANGDACVVMDGDLQDPPELIPKLVERWREGFEVVHAVRQERQGETAVKRFTAYLFYRLINRLSETPIAQDAGDFRLIDRRVVLALRRFHEQGRFLRGLVNWVGFKQTSVPYIRESRTAGETKFSMSRMVTFALDAITAFSSLPLRLATGLGLSASVIGFGYALVVFYLRYFTGRTITGWSSLMIAILFFGGIQLLCVGVLGEYIGRIYNEVKQRPLYLIDSLEGFDELPRPSREASTDLRSS